MKKTYIQTTIMLTLTLTMSTGAAIANTGDTAICNSSRTNMPLNAAYTVAVDTLNIRSRTSVDSTVQRVASRSEPFYATEEASCSEFENGELQRTVHWLRNSEGWVPSRYLDMPDGGV